MISEAIPPKSKDPLSAAVAMLLGIMLGGALGAGSGLVLTAFDRRLRAAEQVAAVTSVECFGYMPRIAPQSSLPSEPDHNDLDSRIEEVGIAPGALGGARAVDDGPPHRRRDVLWRR